jgi:protocatechuate 3,4-dioxygenase beta subunit
LVNSQLDWSCANTLYTLTLSQIKSGRMKKFLHVIITCIVALTATTKLQAQLSPSGQLKVVTPPILSACNTDTIQLELINLDGPVCPSPGAGGGFATVVVNIPGDSLMQYISNSVSGVTPGTVNFVSYANNQLTLSMLVPVYGSTTIAKFVVRPDCKIVDIPINTEFAATITYPVGYPTGVETAVSPALNTGGAILDDAISKASLSPIIPFGQNFTTYTRPINVGYGNLNTIEYGVIVDTFMPAFYYFQVYGEGGLDAQGLVVGTNTFHSAIPVANAVKTLYDAKHYLYKFTISGAALGPDFEYTPGERLTFYSSFTPPSVCTTLNNKAYISYSCANGTPCTIPDTLSGNIKISAGRPVISGINYTIDSFDGCPNKNGVFSFKNTASGVHPIGTAYDVTLNLDFGSAITVSNLKFAGLNIPGGSPVTAINTGSSVIFNIKDLLTSDPDGVGGLQDLDGDGYFDDLKTGDSVRVNFTYTVPCNLQCGTNLEYNITSRATFTDFCRNLNGGTNTSMYRFGFRQEKAVIQSNIPNYGLVNDTANNVNYKTKSAGFTFQFKQTNMNLNNIVAKLKINYNNSAELDTSNVWLLGSKIPGSAFTFQGVNLPGDSNNSFDSIAIYQLTPAQLVLLFDTTKDSLHYGLTLYNCERRQRSTNNDFWQIVVQTNNGNLCAGGVAPCELDLSCKKSYAYIANYGCGNKPCFYVYDTLYREKLTGYTSVAQTTPLIGSPQRMYEGDTIVFSHQSWMSNDWPIEKPIGTYKDFDGLRVSFSTNYSHPEDYRGQNPLLFLEDISRLQIYSRDSVTGAKGAILYDVPLKLKHFITGASYYNLVPNTVVQNQNPIYWYSNVCPTCTPYSTSWCGYNNWAVDAGNCPIDDTSVYRGSPYWALFQNVGKTKSTTHSYMDLETALADAGLQFKLYNDNLYYEVNTRWRINDSFPWANNTDFQMKSVFGRTADGNSTTSGEAIGSCGTGAAAGAVAPKELTIANPNSAYLSSCGLTVKHLFNFNSYGGDYLLGGEVRVPYKIDSFKINLPNQYSLVPGSYSYSYNQSCASQSTTAVTATDTIGNITFRYTPGGDFPRIDDCAGLTNPEGLTYGVKKIGVAAPTTYKYPVTIYARTEWGQVFQMKDSVTITEANPQLTVTPIIPVVNVEDGNKCSPIFVDFLIENNTLFAAPNTYLAAENTLANTSITTMNDAGNIYADPIIPADVTSYGTKNKFAKVGTIGPGESRIVRVLVSSAVCLDSFRVYVDFGCQYPNPLRPILTSGTIDSLMGKIKGVKPSIATLPVADVNVQTLCGTDTIEVEVRNVRSVNVYQMKASFKIPVNVKYVAGASFLKGDTRSPIPPSYLPVDSADVVVTNNGTGDSVVMDLRNLPPFNTACGLIGADTLNNATVRIRFEVEYDACPTLNVEPIKYQVSATSYCGELAKARGVVNIVYVGSIGTPNIYSCTESVPRPLMICAKKDQAQDIIDTLFVQNFGGYGPSSGPSSGRDTIIITIPTDSSLFKVENFVVGAPWGTPVVGSDPKGNITLSMQVPAGLNVGDSLPLPLQYRVTSKVPNLCETPSTTCPNLSFFTSFVSNVYLECPTKGIVCTNLSKEIRGRGLQIRPFICCGSISNYVWLDRDKDGTQDANEVGVAGVPVSLYQNGLDGLPGTTDDNLVGTTVTDAKGHYIFEDLLPSLQKELLYNVSITLPAGYVPTTPFNRGDNQDNANSDGDTTIGNSYARTTTVNIARGENDSTLDFGIYFNAPPTAYVGDYVWVDSNKNGLQDPGEKGLAGVVVALKDNTGKTVAVTTTDANGKYLFSDVKPGTGYSITVSPVIGYVPSAPVGSPSSPTNSDINVSTYTTLSFNVNAGDSITYIDAGLAPIQATRASLGDRVWFDANRNGLQDAGEGGVPGVTVRLLNGPGTSTLATQVTDAFGNYAFTNLNAGSYRVEFSLAGFPTYTITSKTAGTNVYIDSNPDSVTGRTDIILLGAGEANMSIDAGIFSPSNTNSVGDYVWNDKDQDGIQDSTEDGIAGVTVTLFNSAGTPIAVTTTDPTGKYQFVGVPNGTYSVGFSNIPPGYQFSPKETTPSAIGSDADQVTGKTASFSLAGGANKTDIDAGIYLAGNEKYTASIGDFVWYDLNNNGIQDANEKGVEGVTATLLNAGQDGIIGNGDDGPSLNTLTNSMGRYIFTNLAPSNYAVRFTGLPAGYGVSPANVGSDSSDSDPISLIGGAATTGIYPVSRGTDNLTLDLGIYKPGVNNLGNYVWLDANGDGQQGTPKAEPPVPGVQVRLLDSAGIFYDLDPATPGIQPYVVTTDLNGQYLFTNLPNGMYRVEFTNLPAGLSFTTRGSGTATDSDPDTASGLTSFVMLTGGNTNLDLDAGLVTTTTAAVGDYVWYDTDLDGVQDATEAGFPGIEVSLFNTSGNVVATTITDANGAYLFTNVDPGTYSVGFKNLPGAASFTTKDATADTLDSDADPITGRTPTFTLAAGQVRTDLDAGIVIKPKGSIGNYVWFDQNKDGKQDASEPGVAGTTVQLYNAADNTFLASAVTNGAGYYSFTNLDTGTNKYIVKFTPTAGYKLTTTGGTLLDENNSDANQVTGITSPISVAAGIFNDRIDAGLVIDDTLGNYVWLDNNANGIQDAGEPGIAGVTVTLYDNVTGKVKAATVTDALGFYEFSNIGKGQYFLKFTVPTGYTFTSNLDPTGNFVLSTPNNSDISNTVGTTKPFLFETGQVNRNADVGLILIAPKGSIGNYVWLDTDADGLQDPTEAGIAGVVVTLIDDNGNQIASTITDDDGKYIFNELPAGTYQVKFSSPVGVVPTSTNSSVVDANNSDMDPATNTTPSFVLNAGENITYIDAGFVPQSNNTASLGDRVWYDVNNNGVQDAGEAGVPNVAVSLLDASGGLLSSTTTDALGNYIFNGLLPASYRVQFSLPSGFGYSPQSGTTDSTLDSNPDNTGLTSLIPLAAGQKNMTIDAGIYNSANNNAIGDFVWKDLNENGLQDASEPGVAGINVTLFDASGLVYGHTVTDANGSYLFAGLPNGTYSVKFSNLPSDLTFTKQTTNTTNGSDPNSGGFTPQVTVTGGQTNRDLDAGLVTAPNLPSVASLGDKVWYDLNNNGLQDASEPGVGAVKVYLYDATGVIKIDSTYTDALGNYMFYNLGAGTYVVGFALNTLPANSTVTTMNADGQGIAGANNSDANMTTGKTAPITLGAGAEVRTVDMGIVPAVGTSTVGDFVWFDLDKDGIQDAGEPGVAGVTVALFDAQGTQVAATTTDANGKYLFANVLPGQYTVGFNNFPSGYALTTKTAGTANGSDPDFVTRRTAPFTVAANTNVTDIDAGLITNTRASLGNYVWHDADNDGVQDAGEDPVPNVKVKLYNSVGTEIAQTTTDLNGKYNFSNLLPGTYSVGFSSQFSTLVFTTKEASASSDTGSNANTTTGLTDNITLAAGQYNPTIDAGIIANPSGSVGNYVWYDLDKDGIQDANEKGVPGVMVTLRDNTGTVVGVAITDGNGAYLFNDVAPGTGYTVQFSNLPPTYLFTTQSGNVYDSTNSDALPNGYTPSFEVLPGQYVSTIDAGIVTPTPGSLGNFVWYDVNRNGIQDNMMDPNGTVLGPEKGVEGVIVQLRNSVTNAIVMTDTTDAFGYYLFTSVPANSYYIQLVPSSFPDTSYHLTKKDIGTNDSIDSDVDSVTKRSSVFAFPNQGFDMTRDAGLITETEAEIGDPCTCFDVVYFPGENFQVLDEMIVKGPPGQVWRIVTHTGVQFIDSNLYITVPFMTPLVEDSAGYYSFKFAHDVAIGYVAYVSNGVDTLTISNTCFLADIATDNLPDTVCANSADITLIGTMTKTVGGVAVPVNGTAVFYIIDAVGDTTILSNNLFDPTSYTVNAWAKINYRFIPNDPTECPRELLDSVYIDGNCPSLLGNFVWNDLNKNGVQDLNEPGVAGVAVTLYNSAGQVVKTTLTDAYGIYEFKDLATDLYTIAYTLPANYVFTTNTDPTGTNVLSTATNSDVDSATDRTKPFLFEAGTINRNADAGIYYQQPISSSIGNFVWDDLDSNGIQDAGEPGISNVVVTLYDTTGKVVASTLTNANGNYLFKDVPPGAYQVGFTTPIGYVPTVQTGGTAVPNNSDLIASTNKTSTFTLTAGENNLNLDAGFNTQGTNRASLGNYVWFDTDQDGNQDANEEGVAKVTVELYNAGGTLIKTTTTDALGYYVFNDLAAAGYSVKFVLPSGYVFTPQNSVSDINFDSNPNTTTGIVSGISLTAGERNMTIDAGIYNANATNSIGDKVWSDLNSDGLQDATEPGVPGVSVTLFDNVGNNIATTTTDRNGEYVFAGLPNGTYSVGFSNFPNGTTLTNQTTNTANGSDANPATGKTPTVTLTGNTFITDLDAGLKPTNIPSGTASLGDKVWWDMNNNGLQDPTERGVAAVRVYLYNAAGTTKLDSTWTDATGKYMFTGLLAGTYQVGFDLTTKPSGTTVSTINANGMGISNNMNSDADPITGRTATVTLATGEENLAIDMGIVPAAGTASVGDKVWLDADSDGIQDLNEPGMPGVQVALLNNVGNPIAYTTTDANGNYVFANLVPGNYSVQFSGLPAGTSFTTQTTGTTDGSDADTTTGKTPSFTLTAGQNKTDIDAGLKTLRAALGNYVWFDANSNGIQDASEAGIPGVSATLLDKVGNRLANAVTDENGYYFFGNLNPGQYLVEFANFSSGTVFTQQETTPAANGSDANVLSGRTPLIVLTAGQVNLDIDAGVKPGVAASLGDFVWLDADKDGIQDATEVGVAGVKAELLNSVGTVIGESITDGAGYYNFASVPPGSGYSVRFSNIAPSFKLTTKTGTVLDSLNSDIDTAGLFTTAQVTLANGQRIPHLDAGLIKRTINLYGNVWHDVNALTDNRVNNTGALVTPVPLGIPLGMRAFLVRPSDSVIVGVANVFPSTQNFAFFNIDPGTTYLVILSTLPGGIGAKAPAAKLPLGWNNTGEKLGITPGSDGIPNGRLIVPSSNVDVYNANFGIRTNNNAVVIP